ncbi:MAG: glycosyltransferase family 2 protein [Planctomycetota bacterium]
MTADLETPPPTPPPATPEPSAESNSLSRAAPAPQTRLARIEVLAPVSVVVPVYHEADNLPHLIERVEQVRNHYGLDLELVLVDDNSRDGSVEIVEQAGRPWVRMLVRTEDPGLSQSVLHGLRSARHPVVVVMDGDLSHPPERIPDMILALDAGQQFVIGSRYVPGGSTDDDWGFFRWLNSRVATALAKPLTKAKDPMAGFFAFRRADLDRAEYLNPVGYKIGLELIVKCRFDNIGEVPIDFCDRQHGESKLTFKQQLKYVQHLRRLYLYRFAAATTLIQFGVVGASGVAVNLTVLTILALAGAADPVAVAGGIAVSVVTNFLLNRRFTFSYARNRSIVKQFVGFCGASAMGAVVNYAVTLGIKRLAPDLPLQVAALGGIAAGMTLNFLVNRFVVFKATHHREPGAKVEATPPALPHPSATDAPT